MSFELKIHLVHCEHALKQPDMTELLEHMDFLEALPTLRQISRQRKPAANSCLAVAFGVISEKPELAQDFPNTPSPT